MKRFIALILCVSASTAIFANKWNYQSAISTIAQTEKKLMLCAPAPDEAGDCYSATYDKYDQMIRDIRNSNVNKIDSRLWQRININYKKQIDSCRDERNLSSKRLFFYPYQDCVSNHMHNFLITTVELHLR